MTFPKLKRAPTDAELAKMPMRNPEKEADNYYYQEYKVACPNIEYAKVTNFLRTADFVTIGMIVLKISV